MNNLLTKFVLSFYCVYLTFFLLFYISMICLGLEWAFLTIFSIKYQKYIKRSENVCMKTNNVEVPIVLSRLSCIS